MVKYTREIAESEMHYERTLEEDTLMLANMLIDQEVKNYAEEELSLSKQKVDIVKAIKDRLNQFKN